MFLSERKLGLLPLQRCCIFVAFFLSHNIYCQEQSLKKAGFFDRVGAALQKGSIEAKNDLAIHNQIFIETSKFSSDSSSYNVAQKGMVDKLKPHLKKEFKELREMARHVGIDFSFKSLFGSNNQKLAKQHHDDIVYDIVVESFQRSRKGDLQASLNSQPDLGASFRNKAMWSIQPVSKPRLQKPLNETKEDEGFDLVVKAGIKAGQPHLAVFDNNKFYNAEVSAIDGLIQEVKLGLFDQTKFKIRHEHNTESTRFVLDGLLRQESSNLQLEYSTEDNSFSTKYQYSQKKSVVGVDLTVPEDSSTKNLEIQMSLGLEL